MVSTPLWILWDIIGYYWILLDIIGYDWILFLLVGPNEAILCFGCKYAQLPQKGSHGNEVKEVSDDWLKKKKEFSPFPHP